MKNIYIILMLLLLLAPPGAGYVYANSVATPSMAYKCQAVGLSVNFSSYSDIVSVRAWANSTSSVLVAGKPTTASESVTLSDQGAGRWTGTLVSDSVRLRGARTLSFSVYAGGINATNTTNSTLIIFPDICTGTGTNYTTQVVCPLGAYTCRLWRGEENLMELSIHTWTDQWGYIFYFFTLFTMCVVVYMKNQNVQQPLIVGLLGTAMIAASGAIPESGRQIIVMMLGVVIGTLLYRIYLRRGG